MMTIEDHIRAETTDLVLRGHLGTIINGHGYRSASLGRQIGPFELYRLWRSFVETSKVSTRTERVNSGNVKLCEFVDSAINSWKMGKATERTREPRGGGRR